MENFAITNTNHKNLDGIRAIGILGVFLVHFFWRFGHVLFAWISIDLLFALSGLLITGILIETKDDPKYFKKFYMRRVLRIFPIYYLTLICFTIFIYSNNNPGLDYYRKHLLSFYTYTQNWSFISQGMPYDSYLEHTWSLAVDEQIYLVWPLLIWICKTQKQLIYLCGGLLIFSFCFRFLYIDYINPNRAINPFPYWFHTFCRVDSFGAGSLLYCLLKFKSKWLTNSKIIFISLGSFVLLAMFSLLDNTTYFTRYYMSHFGITVAGIHFTTWLYFGIKGNYGFLNAIWGNKILVYIGKISYSLYVYHWVILGFLMPLVSDFLVSYFNITSLMPATLICLLATFAVSMLSYNYIEKPIIILKRRFSYK